MNKILIRFFIFSTLVALLGGIQIQAADNYKFNDIPLKSPTITPSMKPAIVEYNKGNYVGCIQLLKDVVEKEKKNDYAKYYLANCYSQLGYKSESQDLYKEIVENKQNYALSYYSQRAMNCIDNPDSTECLPPSKNKQPLVNKAKLEREEAERKRIAEERQQRIEAKRQASSETKAQAGQQSNQPNEEEKVDDITAFIRSGQKIHPAAMDRITTERMLRHVEEEQLKAQENRQ
ncbi:tetratricopeptide repeat protein [bacterium]|nr:tetratricopeptide repeat protein [bacterium]